MGRVEITCLALGAALVTLGAGLVFVPAAPITMGALLIALGYDRGAKS